MDLDNDLLQRLLARPAADERYYLFRFIGLPDGTIETSCSTYWVGWDDVKRGREVRRGREMGAREAAWHQSGFSRIHEDCLVVRNADDLLFFFIAGGNALIEKRLAESHLDLKQLIAPRVCVPSGSLGFRSADKLPPAAMQRAPTPKVRMGVLKRDDYRCRICGRRASDEVDIQLHVHHIRPWAIGGITADENLITLCHTCHTGLSPHSEWRLFDLLGPDSSSGQRGQAGDYRTGLERYWALTSSAIQKLVKSQRRPSNRALEPTART